MRKRHHLTNLTEVAFYAEIVWNHNGCRLDPSEGTEAGVHHSTVAQSAIVDYSEQMLGQFCGNCVETFLCKWKQNRPHFEPVVVLQRADDRQTNEAGLSAAT